MNITISQEKPQAQTAEFTYKKINGYLYEFQAVLGKGNFSTVYKGIQESTNQLFAIKVVQLSSLTCKKLEELLDQEISIIQELNHRNVIQCIEVLKSKNNCYIITELCEGGTLQKTIQQKGSFNEGQIWQYVLDIYQGLKYLTSKNIIHRDLKPANIFVKDKTLKIADFGFAIKVKSLFQDCNVGSPIYMAPQGFLHSIYGPKTDIWALGVIIFELLHGYPPLINCTKQEDLKNHIAIEIHDSQFHPKISPQVKNLIKRCLEVDQTKRINFQQLQSNNFLQRYAIMRSLSTTKIHPQLTRRNSAINIQPRGQLTIKKDFLNVPKINLKQMRRTSQRNKQNNNLGPDHINLTMNNSKIKENKSNTDRKQLNQYLLPSIDKKPDNLLSINRQKVIQNASFYVKYSSILNGKISYNEAIGFLHYCRIGFKIIPYFHQDRTTRIMIKSIIIKVLQEINEKLTSSELKFVDDENKEKKQQKLKKVLEQYIFKYHKLIEGQTIKLKLKDLCSKLQSFLAQLQQNIRQSKVYNTYLTFIFTLYTKLLMNCQFNGSYSIFGENGYIDTCLNQNNQYYSIVDYHNEKRRFCQHYQIMI